MVAGLKSPSCATQKYDEASMGLTKAFSRVSSAFVYIASRKLDSKPHNAIILSGKFSGRPFTYVEPLRGPWFSATIKSFQWIVSQRYEPWCAIAINDDFEWREVRPKHSKRERQISQMPTIRAREYLTSSDKVGSSSLCRKWSVRQMW